ncbi:MAG: TolC family protein [Chitinophagaceae bacterium]
MSFKKIVSFLFLFSTSIAKAQEILSIEACYKLAQENYPLIKQQDLLQQSNQLNLQSLENMILPQINIQGQATGQSEVTKINIPIQGIDIKSPSYFQWKLMADISQPLTDLFIIKNQKQTATLNNAVQNANVEVELYKIKERINQLYFGALLVNEQLSLAYLVDKDLQSGRERIQAAIKNGVEYRTNLDKIDAQILQNEQRKVELISMRNGYFSILEKYINQPVSEHAVLKMPEEVQPELSISRPEIGFFESKKAALQSQTVLVKNKSLPKLSLFAQTGFGQPSPLNFLNTQLNPFLIGGVRMNWSINNIINRKNEMSLLKLDQKSNDIQKELFEFAIQNNSLQMISDIQKIKQLLLSDEKIIALRNQIKQTANAQLASGVITANDYIKEVNAEDQARQNKLLHALQLLTTQYAIQFNTGKN